MKIKVKYDGEVYCSKSTDEDGHKFSNDFYENIPDLTQFYMQLDDESVMVFGKDVIQKAIFIFEK